MNPVTLSLNGIDIAGNLYLPHANHHPCPAVVMAPGFGGVKEMLIPHYAHALADAGIATLAVDYPYFGASAGEPRQQIQIQSQLDSHTVALDFLQQHSAIDGENLGIWGSSLSGGHALVIAAIDTRVKSVLAIIPFISVSLKMAPRFTGITVKDWFWRKVMGKSQTIKIAGKPHEQAVMNSDGAWQWMQEMTANAPNFVDHVSVSSLLEMANYKTAKAARAIKVPLKVILATDDTITPARMVKSALSKVEKVTFEEYPETHFELFDRHLQDTVESTVSWFQQTLSNGS